MNPLYSLLIIGLIGCDGSKGQTTDTSTVQTEELDVDGDGYFESEDCDDNNNLINPGSEEICDGQDNNCDGEVDEGVTTTFYNDVDEDGYGDSDTEFEACSAENGAVSNGMDCDDSNAEIWPGAIEECDDIDNNCDGNIDEELIQTWYRDSDGDGFGDPQTERDTCAPEENEVLDGMDCDDTDSAQYPEADEVCNGEDDNCDTVVDENTAIDAQTWYEDTDIDTYGDPDSSIIGCSQPVGFILDNTDCDDSDTEQYPGADEKCNFEDDNCDGDIDENTALDAPTWYQDLDNDTFGNPNSNQNSCTQPTGYILNNTDCDDTDSSQNPDADEVCNGEDDNCDTNVDESTAVDAQTWYQDLDNDTFGNLNESQNSCSQPTGHVLDSTDCDDGDDTQNPDADEVCNGEDDNCDTNIDESTAIDAQTWYQDLDNDTFGDSSVSQNSCTQPTGYILNNTDCDDTDSSQNPDADEVCNGEDDNCDTNIDESTAVDAQTWYQDVDNDTFGDSSVSQNSCSQPSGYVQSNTDCDDGDDAQNPDADELCNGEDDNCDTVVDEDTAVDAQTWYQDLDNDTFGNPSASQNSCTQPTGYILNDADCDDTDNAQNPDADELCNGEDDNCDTVVDEDTATDALLWYEDSDNDAFGDPDSTTYSCAQPSTFVANQLDCNDQDASINPNGTEICNGDDDDCDGVFDAGALGEDEVCVASSCAAILSDNSSAPDGTYWITESNTAVQAYCDMELGTALCSEIEQDRSGVTRDLSGLPYKMRAVLEPSQGRCAVWAVRHATTNTPFGGLSTSYASLNTCQALGFITDSLMNSCSYGASYGNCGYTSDLYYRYGNACGGCSLNDGYLNRYMRQGYMSSASVISTMSGSVRSYCTTE